MTTTPKRGRSRRKGAPFALAGLAGLAACSGPGIEPERAEPERGEAAAGGESAAGEGAAGVAAEEHRAMKPDDPYMWLEEIEGERALAWVEERNRAAVDRLEGHPLFEPIHDRTRAIFTSVDRIPYPQLRGGQVYNFWRDDEHVRGIWRRADRDGFRAEDPPWEVLLDVDELAEEEGENWVWGGAQCRSPDYDRCLVALSRGGADAQIVREFDLEARAFVSEGFSLPESKSRLTWRSRDSLYLAPALRDEDMTDSGYPRTVSLWRRGEDPEDAEVVFEGERGDVSVGARRVWDRDEAYDFIVRAPDFFSREYHLYRDGEVRRLELPGDADLVGVLNGRAVVQLRSAWTAGEAEIPAGALASASVEDLLAGDPAPVRAFVPTASEAVAGVAQTRNTIVAHVLDDVVSRLVRLTPDDGGGWDEHRLSAPDLGTIGLVSADRESDAFYYDYTSFLTPNRLVEADAAADGHDELRQEKAWFDASGMEVSQLEAESADGTRVPYFVVSPEGDGAEEPRPTLLTAYGGFQVARTPRYSGEIGAAWLERGGAFVLANIRGGGEYGPEWHQAALRDNRQRAFDDFIAVAEDLVSRGVTTPDRLGIRGGSNGGLLVGAALTQRPELFGAAVAQVPLFDMRRYHELLAGASWMAEYGDPDDPDDWAFIREYSPYHNVDPDADYPEILITTSTRDDRVHPGHARKMAAKMLGQGHDVLYYENIEGGHGGAADLVQAAYISTLIYTYLHDRLTGEEGARDAPRAGR